jgi:hypothetical protein
VAVPTFTPVIVTVSPLIVAVAISVSDELTVNAPLPITLFTVNVLVKPFVTCPLVADNVISPLALFIFITADPVVVLYPSFVT